jgi:Insulinase (Peptidase family M16)
MRSVGQQLLRTDLELSLLVLLLLYVHGCAETGYYFDCNSAQLPTALEMFSQFFRSALFAPDSLDRELKSVDSEHAMNQSEDQWRLFQVCIINITTLHSSLYCNMLQPTRQAVACLCSYQ